MALARYLADTSAMSRMRHPVVRAALGPLVEQGVVGTCGALDLEALFSVRNGKEHRQLRLIRSAMPPLSMPDEVWDRAVEVQGQLADRGEHRCASLVDLLICATAERHNVTVLHYDADFDTIGRVTGQSTRWVVPRGTVDTSHGDGE